MRYAAQSKYRVRFESGVEGTMALDRSSAIVIVDTLSFTTCVDIVVSQGGAVLPFPYKDERESTFAADHDAILAEHRSKDAVSLSPASLLNRGALRIVLPSPNGSYLTRTLANRFPDSRILAGSLRNADAIGGALGEYDTVSVIAAGERWEDGSTRFALEDFLAAGAIISRLRGTKSPEALAAEASFRALQHDLSAVLLNCASGRELVERGFESDVLLASELAVSSSVPLFRDVAFVSEDHPSIVR